MEIKLSDPEIHSYKGKSFDIEFDFTINKFGLYCNFDGEVFEDSDCIFNSNQKYYNDYGWYIQTIKLNKNKFIVYFIPTESRLISIPETKVEKYLVTKEILIKHIIDNPKNGIWEIDFSDPTIVVNNFMWYYLGLFEAGIKTEIDLNKSYKFRETRKLLKKYTLDCK